MNDSAVRPLVALVVGGDGGIGSATLRQFISAGWRAACVDLRPGVDSDVLHVVANIRTATACRDAVNQVMSSLERIDVLVNAAGLATTAWLHPLKTA